MQKEAHRAASRSTKTMEPRQRTISGVVGKIDR